MSKNRMSPTLQQCTISNLPEGLTAKSKRFVAIDVDNFKAYNTVFGYEKATQMLDEFSSFLSLLVNNEIFGHHVIEGRRIGGDEFLLFLNVDNKPIENKIQAYIERYAPINATTAFGSDANQALRSLAVESYLQKGSAKREPLSRRHNSTDTVSIEFQIIDIDVLKIDYNLNLTVGITLHWTDERLTQLSNASPDTFSTEENVWFPTLNIIDSYKKNKSRTLRHTVEGKYNLRARSIKESIWKKKSNEDYSEKEKKEKKKKLNEEYSEKEKKWPIIEGNKYVFSSEKSPYAFFKLKGDDDSWKHLGFVRSDEGAFKKDYTEYPLKNQEYPRDLVEDETDKKFVRFIGYLNEAKRYSQDEILRKLNTDTAMFFPFDYIEDYVGFIIRPDQSSQDIHFKVENKLYGRDQFTDDWFHFQSNGFKFRIHRVTLTTNYFLGRKPYLHVLGWRNSGPHLYRLQWPMIILNLLTCSVFFFQHSELSRLGILLSAYITTAALLLAASSYISTKDGQLTIIDVQIIFNLMFLLYSAGFVLRDRIHDAVVTGVIKDEDESDELKDPISLLWFLIPGVFMFHFNLIFTFNLFNLAVEIRYCIAMIISILTCGQNHRSDERKAMREMIKKISWGREREKTVRKQVEEEGLRKAMRGWSSPSFLFDRLPLPIFPNTLFFKMIKKIIWGRVREKTVREQVEEEETKD